MGDGVKIPQAYLDFSRWDRNKIPTSDPPIFDDGYSNGTTSETVRCDQKWKIQDSGL